MYRVEDNDLHLAYMKKFKIKSMKFVDGSEIKIDKNGTIIILAPREGNKEEDDNDWLNNLSF